MSRTALILAAHGSHHEARVNESIRAHAASMAAERRFDEVWVAFHQGQPRFSQALDATSATQVVVVPVMTSEGHYCDEVLPRELLKNARANGGARTPVKDRRHTDHASVSTFRLFDFSTIQLAITPPVGTHPSLASWVAKRIEAWRADRGFRSEEVAVVLAGHGTKRHARSRIATARLAASVRALSVCGETRIAFLDEEPRIDSIRAQIHRPNVLVMPFLIGGGPHALEDIPQRMGVGSAEAVYVDAPIGDLPGIRSIIRDLAWEALKELAVGAVSVCDHFGTVPGDLRSPRSAGQRLIRGQAKTPSEGLQARAVSCDIPKIANRQSPIANPRVSTFRLGTRRSALARWQARHVADMLAQRGIATELVDLSTTGDRRLDCAISALGSDSPFTDDIDAALRGGEIDFAVHALKDLPVPAADDLDLAALLPRGDVSEALVSHDGRSLSELSVGASVGTSSPRRAAQLLALRSDLRPTTIRGAVDDRVWQVRRGDFDAAILATAGLQRLDLTHEIAETFSLEAMLPAPGQGALVIQTRRDDDRLRTLLAPFDHAPTRRAVTAELELLRLLQDSPHRTVAAWAVVDDEDLISLHARLVSLDGFQSASVCVRGNDPVELGFLAAEKLLAQSPISNFQSAISS